MKKSLAVLLICLFAIPSFAQPAPDTLWTRTYGGSSYDEAHSVQQTSDGGYIVAGSTCSFGAGSWDFYLVKTNSEGDTLWTRTYGGNSSDEAYSAQQTADGGYIVAGYTASMGAGSYDFYLVKTNSEGDTLWTRTYGGSIEETAYSVQQTFDGGYVIGGYSRFFGSNNDDFYLELISKIRGTNKPLIRLSLREVRPWMSADKIPAGLRAIEFCHTENLSKR